MINYIRPSVEDNVPLKAHYKEVITHTFQVHDIDDADDLQKEIDTKYGYIENYYSGRDTQFIAAKHEGVIIGAIGLYHPNTTISELTEGALDHLYELGSLYVNPSYQGQGIGSELIKRMQDDMRLSGINQYCFDAAYTTAIKTWTKMFGPATYIFKDYWGKDEDHHIWVITL